VKVGLFDEGVGKMLEKTVAKDEMYQPKTGKFTTHVLELGLKKF